MMKILRKILKECFWLVCSAAIIISGWAALFLSFNRINNLSDLWFFFFKGSTKLLNQILQGDSLFATLVLVPLAVIYFIRLLGWMRG
jgi:hypothetical protein